MPRAKKTASGAPAQKIEAIKGQTYGEGVVQERLQQTMPAPNKVAQMPQVSQGSQPAPQVETPSENIAPQQQMNFNDLKNSLQGQGGVLFAPDDQPDVPFNQMPTQEQRSNKLGSMMRDLSKKTGDPIYQYLADRSGF